MNDFREHMRADELERFDALKRQIAMGELFLDVARGEVNRMRDRAYKRSLKDAEND